MTEELRGPVGDWAVGRQAWLEQWYQQTRNELLDVGEHPQVAEATDPPTGPLPAVPPSADYRYRDPISDPAWPNIAGPGPGAPPDVFPPSWGAEPTERDRAAIDAGNA